MQDQLSLLEDLQKIDVRLTKIQTSLKTLPERLSALKTNVERVGEMLDGEKARMEAAISYKAELEQATKEDQELLSKTKAKLQQVKNSREYIAVQREFESGRQVTTSREDEVSKLNDAIDNLSGSIKEHGEDLEKLRQSMIEEEEAIHKEIEGLKEESGKLQVDRNGMAEKIQPNLIRRYDNIRKTRGLAVVSANKGVCTGCHMALPPQLYNILHKGDTIELCPNCQRIVYVNLEPAQEAASA